LVTCARLSYQLFSHRWILVECRIVSYWWYLGWRSPGKTKREAIRVLSWGLHRHHIHSSYSASQALLHLQPGRSVSHDVMSLSARLQHAAWRRRENHLRCVLSVCLSITRTCCAASRQRRNTTPLLSVLNWSLDLFLE